MLTLTLTRQKHGPSGPPLKALHASNRDFYSPPSTPHCPRQESNLDLELRRLAWFPFHHGDGKKCRMRNASAESRSCGPSFLPLILHSSFSIQHFPLLAPARTRTQNSTFEASRDVRFHHKGIQSRAARTAGAARNSGPGFRRRRRRNFVKQKTPKPSGLRGSFSAENDDPGHPVKARRSSERSARRRSAERSERDSSAPLERAHAPPRPRRSVPSSEANCRDWVNMASTMKTASDERVVQYVSATGRKSISFSTDFIRSRIGR